MYVIILIISIILSFDSAQALEDKKTLDIAYMVAIPPYIYEVNEVITGQLVHSIYSILGEKFSVHITLHNQESVQQSPISVLIGSKPSVENLPFVKAFTITTIPLTLFYTGSPIRTIEDATSMKIGYVDFGLPGSTLQEYYPFLMIEIYPTVQSLLRAMEDGRVQGCILPEATLSFFTQKHWKQISTPVGYIGVNLYVQKDNTALLNTITSIFVERLIQEEPQSSPIPYVVIFCLLLFILFILFFLYRRKNILADPLLHTTMEVTREVFFDHFLKLMGK